MVTHNRMTSSGPWRAAVLFAMVLAAAPAHAQQGASRAPAQDPGPVLPLSMQQAVEMALEFNLGLRTERLNLDVADQSVASARSAFLPAVQASFGNRTSRSVPTDFTQGTNVLTGRGLAVSTSMQQLLPWYGGAVGVTWNGNRTSQDGGLSAFNPRLWSSLQVTFTQPLLKDLKRDSARVSLQTSERRRAISDIQLEQRKVQTETNAQFAYLNLVASIEGRKVAEQNMQIAEQSLQQSRARVSVGQSPQIDIIQAEAEVASRQEQLIVASAQIETAEDILRSIILDPERPDYWQVKLQPTQTIMLEPREINVDASVKNALESRLDLIAQRRNLEIAGLNVELGRNNTLPSVDFNASYEAQGTGGTQFVYGSGFPPPVVSRTDRSFGSALGDTFTNAYPTWTVGVSVSYPLGTSAADAAYAQARVQQRQQELSIHDLELEVVRQVRDAARQVVNSFERVQATRTARTASEQQLQAEERRFAVGLSTTLELQVRQRDLASARIAELNAMIAYNRALITLARVQKTQ